jgi:hypothetical protein
VEVTMGFMVNFGVLNRTQTGTRIPTKILSQKNQGTVKIKQKPLTVGDRTPFQMGLTNSPICEKCLEKDDGGMDI